MQLAFVTRTNHVHPMKVFEKKNDRFLFTISPEVFLAHLPRSILALTLNETALPLMGVY